MVLCWNKEDQAWFPCCFKVKGRRMKIKTQLSFWSSYDLMENRGGDAERVNNFTVYLSWSTKGFPNYCISILDILYHKLLRLLPQKIPLRLLGDALSDRLQLPISLPSQRCKAPCSNKTVKQNNLRFTLPPQGISIFLLILYLSDWCDQILETCLIGLYSSFLRMMLIFHGRTGRF